MVSCTEVLKFWVFDLFEGKREAEQQLEKQVAKKQKGDEGVAQAVVKQKVEVKTQKKKKVETSSSEDDSSSESEEEVNFVNFMFQLLLIVYFHEQSEVITVWYDIINKFCAHFMQCLDLYCLSVLCWFVSTFVNMY